MPPHFKSDPEEEEDWTEKVMAAMCHGAETYSAIQVNGEDDEYYKQPKQKMDGLVPSPFP